MRTGWLSYGAGGGEFIKPPSKARLSIPYFVSQVNRNREHLRNQAPSLFGNWLGRFMTGIAIFATAMLKRILLDRLPRQAALLAAQEFRAAGRCSGSTIKG
jgi:hypothetical protein